jgi:hypothetical protein
MTAVRPLTRAACVLAGLLAGTFADAQVTYPPRPEKVDVQFRYRIRAGRDERVRQFGILEDHLKQLGFERKRTPDSDLDALDPTAERMEGVIPSANALRLLDDPRVKTILFKPTNYQIPDDPAKPVAMRLWIPTGYLPADQERLHRQVVAQLTRLGFREAVGYDHRGYTLVRGDLPAGNLFRLLKDLRSEPAGWFLPDTPPLELPAPLRDTLPIRAVEVLANADLTLLPPPTLAANRLRYTPDLRAVMDDQASLAKPLRVEAVMDHRLSAAELDALRARLRSSYSRTMVNPTTQLREQAFATLEGGVGNVVTVDFPQGVEVERFLQEPGVLILRLPRAAVQTVNPLPEAAPAAIAPADLLSATRVGAFHQLGYRGQGTRVVIVATDFPGLGTAKDAHFLDKSLATPVSLIDLTSELSRDLQPAPPAANPSWAGTAAARAAHLAAPDAGLILVRVDPAALFQVYSVARFVRGEEEYTQALQSRLVELSIRVDEQQRRYTDAVAEYRRAFQNLSDEEGPAERRRRAKAALDQLIKEEAENAAAVNRALAIERGMKSLAGANVVVNTLVWETGFALDGLSELSQVIDTSFASDALPTYRSRSATRPRPVPRPLWVQAASPSAGSVWAGPFQDIDANLQMEFAPVGVPLPTGEWTHELNFLAVRGADGGVTRDLKGGTKVRLTVQWRETHDPYSYGGLDSVFPLTLRVLQQLDPEGKARASDELKEVARSVGGPYPVVVAPTYGVYEQIVEFAVPADGRYCVMVEGQQVFDPRLPALERRQEIVPRMFAEFLGAAAGAGRPVFASYAPRDAGVGLPGDAKYAITVGETDKPLGTTTPGLVGAGPTLQLLPKPDLLAVGSIDVGGPKVGGSGESAGFAGGVLAGLIGSGAMPGDIIRTTGLQPGGPAMISEGWLRVVPPRTRP